MRRFDSRRQAENETKLTSSKPSVPYIVRLGLPLPQNSGMQL